MNDVIQIRDSWQKIYESVKEYIDKLEEHYKQREESLDRGLAEVKLIDEKVRLLDADKEQLALDRELLEKQQAALRDKQKIQEAFDLRLKEKAARLNSIMAE